MDQKINNTNNRDNKPGSARGNPRGNARGDNRGGRGGGMGGPRGGGGGRRRVISEFDDQVIEIRRVTRVVKGGKRFSFRVTVAVGNKKGRVGVGTSKGLDVAGTIAKAKRVAEKNMFTVKLVDERTISRDIDSKYSASRVRMKPVRKGHGLVAGGSCRIVLELAGVKDVSAKLMGKTTNKLTNALATVRALEVLSGK